MLLFNLRLRTHVWRAHTSFGITKTQAIRDLFALHSTYQGKCHWEQWLAQGVSQCGYRMEKSRCKVIRDRALLKPNSVFVYQRLVESDSTL